MRLIGITCENNIDANQLILPFDGESSFRPIVYTNGKTLLEDFQKQKLEGLVFAIHHFTKKHQAVVNDIKNKIPDIPLAVAYQLMESEVRVKELDFLGAALMKYPDELVDLPGVFTKMFSQKMVRSREHVRYTTNFNAKIMQEHFEFLCSMKNLSEGGAQVQVFGRRLEKGDLFRLYVPRLKLLQSRMIQARVVWTRDIKPKNKYIMNSQMLGLKFQL